MKELKLLVASAGIFLSFSFFAVLQEDVYKREYDGQRFTLTLFAILIERALNAALALGVLLVFGGSKLRLPVLELCNSGVTQSLAMAASNEALRYVSYPTQVLGKSGKMVRPAPLAGCTFVGSSLEREPTNTYVSWLGPLDSCNGGRCSCWWQEVQHDGILSGSQHKVDDYG